VAAGPVEAVGGGGAGGEDGASAGANPGGLLWRGGLPGVAVAFAGRGSDGSRAEMLARIAGRELSVAWARQVHSARVLTAVRGGECGEGDALVAPRGSGLALAVVTADCVPVLVAGPRGLAAIHAGWRGIVAGVVGEAMVALAAMPEMAAMAASPARGTAGPVDRPAPPPGPWVAWIGPAIGPCCYETGAEVAAQVAAASSPQVELPGPAGRPHLDLVLAVRHQLAAAGVRRVYAVPGCTRCDAARLHSYRRDGKGAGRNHAFIWQTAVVQFELPAGSDA
jgi:copper oxidase (laccase) domain-containing protein